jgi:hypothetical protein
MHVEGMYAPPSVNSSSDVVSDLAIPVLDRFFLFRALLLLVLEHNLLLVGGHKSLVN